MQTNVVLQEERDAEVALVGRDQYPHVEEVVSFLKGRKEKISREEFAARIGYSTTTLSQYLNQKYPGNLKDLNEEIRRGLDQEYEYEAYTPEIRKNSELIITAQVIECSWVLSEIGESREVAVLCGESGIGKSATIVEYVKGNRKRALLATLDTTKKTKHQFLNFILSCVPGMPSRAHFRNEAEVFNEVVNHLRGQDKMIIIDEAQYLSQIGLETARGIYDQTGVGFVFSGTPQLEWEFGVSNHPVKNEQLKSRVGVFRHVNPLVIKSELKDVLSGYNLSDASVLKWLYDRCNFSGRRYRWVFRLLDKAHRKSVKQQKPVTVGMIETIAKETGLI